MSIHSYKYNAQSGSSRPSTNTLRQSWHAVRLQAAQTQTRTKQPHMSPHETMRQCVWSRTKTKTSSSGHSGPSRSLLNLHCHGLQKGFSGWGFRELNSGPYAP